MFARHIVCSVIFYFNTLRILYNISSFSAGLTSIGKSTERPWAVVLCDLFLLGLFICVHLSIWPIANKLSGLFKVPLSVTYEFAVSASVQLLDILVVNESFSLWKSCPNCVLWSFPPSLDGILGMIRKIGWLVMFAQSVLVGHFETFGIQGQTKTNDKDAIKRGKHPFILSSMAILWSVRVMTLDKFVFSSFVSVGIAFHTLFKLKNDEENDVYVRVRSKVEEIVF